MIFLRNIYSLVNRVSKDSRLLYFIFTAILMITNTVLLFTEPMGIVAKLAFILIPLGVQMLLLALIKKPGLTFLLLLPKSVLDAFQLVLIKLYGGSFIAVDMFLNVVTTNPTEAGELLSNMASVIIFILAIYIPAIIVSLRSLQKKTKLEHLFRNKMLKISGAILSAGLICFAITQYNGSGFKAKYDLYPANVIYNLDFAIKKWNKMTNCGDDICQFRYDAYRESGECGDEREIYVMVIGETARAMSWGLYGYERETTPFASRDERLVKFHALTQSNTTHKSVPMLLTPADAENYELLYRCKSIITLFKECGFKSVFLTNHSYNQTFMERYFNEADISISLRENGQHSYDYPMVDSLTNILQQDTTSNMFIVMHLYGSHFNYQERYPEEFAQFKPHKAETISPAYKQELINSYDNSILYTDNLLKKTVELIGQQRCKSAIIYTSDHGEDLIDDRRKRFLHASPLPTAYQLYVPFIFWHSDKYRQSEALKYNSIIHNSEYVVSSNEVLFHTMGDLASISSPYLKKELSLCSPNFINKEPSYLTDHDGSIFIEKLPLKRPDRQLLVKMGFLSGNQ